MNLTLSTRRTLVVVSVLLYALIFVPALTSFWFIGLVVLLQSVLFAFVGRQGKNSYTDADENLDERQLADKLRIFRQSYYGVMGFAALMVLANLFVSRDLWTLLTVAFLMLVLSLPTYMLMWLEPAPLPEERNDTPTRSPA
jgi:hypothetical protein